MTFAMVVFAVICAGMVVVGLRSPKKHEEVRSVRRATARG
jgi:hypothetical protein